MFAASLRHGSGVLRSLSTASVNSLKNRHLSCSSHVACKKYNEPMTGHFMARPGGIATFMRLPYQESAEGLYF